ncbi:MAG: hypothetical protein IT162_22070, partial [Bryobacterales bacterium]|nr:hypothetical protein [Bryobacterales bacterium]
MRPAIRLLRATPLFLLFPEVAAAAAGPQNRARSAQTLAPVAPPRLPAAAPDREGTAVAAGLPRFPGGAPTAADADGVELAIDDGSPDGRGLLEDG